MKFQLPQFIETEIKLIGPFTLKQFLWVAGGASLIFVLFIALGPSFIFFLLAAPIAALALALAFIRVQEMPLINYLAYALAYVINPKKYLYRKDKETTISIPNRTS